MPQEHEIEVAMVRLSLERWSGDWAVLVLDGDPYENNPAVISAKDWPEVRAAIDALFAEVRDAETE